MRRDTPKHRGKLSHLQTSRSDLTDCVLQYVELQEEELESKERLIAVEAARISQFYSLLTSSIDVIFKFCDKIPGYNDLCKEDRELLFRSACLELFTLRLSHRSVSQYVKKHKSVKLFMSVSGNSQYKSINIKIQAVRELVR